MSTKSYNPAADPLMPRLFRKVSHQTSVSQRGAFSNKGSFSKELSVYDNETSMMGKEKHTLVQIPLRTKVSTGRPFLMGHSPSISINQTSLWSAKPEEALQEMKIMLQARKEAEGLG
jgi:hypothetical protein